MCATNVNEESLGSSRPADPQQPESELLRVCRIGRAQGLKGEVTVQTFTGEPERRFAAGSTLYTSDGAHTYTVAHSRTFKDRWILHFEGVANRDASEALNGLELYAQADDRDEMIEEDAWYPKDLIGLEARIADKPVNGADSGKAGALVGKVVDMIDTPGQSLLKIRLVRPMVEHADGSYVPAESANAETHAGKIEQSGSRKGKSNAKEPKIVRTALVPFVDQLVPDIDLEAGSLRLDPPCGLIPGL
ncbi:16S rRNA processing protein RimM [Bifidobacterium bohemicum]|uniref:Ribosome maturation factor RimM n=1 Tax=Bifidobacterium bohemicum DSM 22767 TaxID=1437606 RepID=A0A086ZHK6_9BIFI|nr:16S rRNA processing protein rimM [Bifidobacterium bohemicum DSM 22767]SCC04509.1 16S rRNA processing protein RimM [Bifidobacterium bohemicum]